MGKSDAEALFPLMDLVAAGVFCLDADDGKGWSIAFANEAMRYALPDFCNSSLDHAVLTACDDAVLTGQDKVVRLDSHWCAKLKPASPTRVIGTLEPDDDAANMAQSLVSSIYRIADIGMCVTDQNRRFVKVNPAYTQLYGWGEDELINQEFTLVLPEQDRDPAARLHDDFIYERTDESPGEWRVRRKDGTIVPVLVTAARMVLPDGTRYKVTTVLDISEQKAKEAALQAEKKRAENLERVKSEFLASMSHELRTPLNAILGFTEFIEIQAFGPVGNAKYLEYCGFIRRSADHLLSLINDVLSLSASESKVNSQERTVINVAEEAREAIRYFESAARSREIAMSAAIARDKNYYVLANQRSLRQILLNLISNAIKFSAENSIVEIIVTGDRETVQIGVRDQGIGMTPEELAEIGTPFVRGRRAEDMAVQGTGLGVTLSKQLAHEDGGKLEYESVQNEGTTAWVTYPRYSQE